MLFSVISQHCTWCITAGCQYLFGLVRDLSEERTISKISCTTMSFKVDAVDLLDRYFFGVCAIGDLCKIL